MSISSSFYYLEKGEQALYSREPQGQLVVGQMLKSKPYWKKTAYPSDLKQKKLILADWRINTWSSEQLQDVEKVIEPLINDGFTIYIRHEGKLQVLTKDMLLSLKNPSFRKDIKVVSPQTLIHEAFEQHKLLPEQIHLLDDYELQCLNENTNKKPERLLEVDNYTNAYGRELVMEILQTAAIKPTQIIQKQFSREGNKSVHELSQEFLEAKLFASYQKLILKSGWTKELITNHSIVDNDVVFHESQLNALQELQIEEQISADELQHLLELTSELQSLKLWNYDTTTELKRNCSLPELETIRFERSILGLTDLQKLLSKSAKVKKLLLSQCEIPENFTADLNCSQLEELAITGGKVSANDIHEILSKASKLKSVSISIRTPKSYLSKHIILPELTQLSLRNTDITAPELHQLLLTSPKLQSLDLRLCKHLTAGFPAEINLPNLEKLELYNSNISTNNLHNILSASPRLKSLSLSNCGLLTKNFANNVHLSELEKLEITTTNISSVDLQSLLSKNSKLKSLKLTRYVFADNPIDDFDLPNLETLDLEGSDITTEELQKLIGRTTGLKTLKIGGCRSLTELSGFNFSKLKTLDANACKFKADEFLALLNNAPELESLSLSNFKLKEGFFSHDIKLPKLENLDISDSNITSNDLQKLLRGAKLKSLQWHRVTEDKIDELNLSDLEQLNITEAELSKTSLQKLLKSCPKITALDLSKVNFPEGVSDLEWPVGIDTLTLLATNITTNDLEILLAKLPKLRYLDISNCNGIELTDSLREKLKKIDSVYLPEHLSEKWGSESHTTQEIHIEPTHNVSEFRNFKPTSDTYQFKFIGKNKSKNQNMLIEKLSQYLTLTQKHAFLIPKIKDGICNALCTLFRDLSQEEWQQLVNDSQAWDGRKATLESSELPMMFETMIDYVMKYQLSPSNEWNYVGDNLASLLASKPEKIIVANPWHAVIAKYNNKEMTWEYYDPNSPNGVKVCTDQELLSNVRKSLGELVSVASPTTFSPLIKDPKHFIREGGLLTLSYAKNIKEIIPLLIPANNLSPDDLEGILLRGIDGAPAWIKGLKSPFIQEYTLQLIEQLILQNPKDFREKLARSIDVLAPKARVDYLSLVIGQTYKNPDTLATLCEILKTTPDTSYFEEQLCTWHKKTSPAGESVLEYCQKIIQDGAKKQLVEFDNTDNVDAMRWALESYCQNTSRPFYYINSPEDLVCSSPFIRCNGKEGILTRGPGGSLHDFLLKHQSSQPAPVILVNYENFAADDIVRFNSLLDRKRFADGTPVPESAQIVGLVNINSHHYYTGEDFYSRFDRVLTSPFKRDAFVNYVAKLPPIISAAKQKTTAINLYHGTDWEEKLLGKWVIHGDKLLFEEGELVAAFKTGLPLEIRNGLWENKRFQQFWQQAQLRGRIEYSGFVFEVPKSLQLVITEGYDWSALKKQVSFRTEPIKTAEVLNPTRIQQFFTQYECDSQKQTLETLPGLISTHAGQVLEVNLTRPLDENEWARLLDECQKHKVKLSCYCSPSVNLPGELQAPPIQKSSTPISWNKQLNSPITIIESTDVDTTVHTLTSDGKPWQVIDISECNPSHLLINLDGKFNQDKLKFEFTKTEGALLAALEEGTPLILKGNFSAELADALASVLLANETANKKGQLVLVSSDTSAFNYYPEVQQHVAMPSAKKLALEKSFSRKEIEGLVDELFEKESLSRLHARLIQRRIHANRSSNDAWLGMESLPGKIILGAFDELATEEKANAFFGARLSAVQSVLSHSPYVFLAGLTGVGKTTFVEEELIKDGSCLYQGISQLKEWATTQSDKTIYLFLDEATIGKQGWSEFEGLFNEPPGILINEKYYPLSKNHKVVFASNPLDYGAGRTLPPFFTRHGNSVVFEPLSQEAIYEKTLKPIFEKTPLAEQSMAISKELLKIYRYVCGLSEREVLISSRELQMMALMTLTHYQRHSGDDSLAAAKHYAYEVAKDLIPATHRAEFDGLFFPEERLTPNFTPPKNPTFLVTPSREPIWQQLDDLLTLRDYRRNGAANKGQRYGGLGGLIVEGEPGIGKSELVIEALLTHGYQEVHESTKSLVEKPFYRIPVSMELDEKKRLLLKAFHEGAVVVLDEINSSPMIESLLNDLLMGKTPEGKRPDKPGFLLIGTQNPVTMAGRHNPSTALARRLLKNVLPNYDHEEMRAILMNKGATAAMAIKLVIAYEKQRDYARLNKLKPIPSFRDLLRLTEQIIEGQEKLKNIDQRLAATQETVAAPPPESKQFKQARGLTFFESTKEGKLEDDSLSKKYSSSS